MAKLRIVVFSRLFWPEGGGGEVATFIITKEILSKYFDIIIVSGTREPSTDILKCCKYIHWEVLKSSFKPLEWLKLLLSNNILKKFVNVADIIYIPSHTLLPLAVIAKKIKPRVKVILHLHNYQPLTYTSVILYNNKPDLRNDLIVERYEHNSTVRAIAAGTLRGANVINSIALYYADLIMCVSKRQYEILTCKIPEIKSKAVVIYNPLPASDFPLDVKSEEPTIIYVGGSSFVKGFHVVLSCLYELISRDLNVKFRLAGYYSPSALKTLRPLLKAPNVKLLGRLNHDVVLRLCSSCWSLLFPSICEEPLPYAVMEAMAVGTIPIASRVGGVPEIVEGTPAEDFLFKPNDSDELVSKIEKLLNFSRDDITETGIKLRESVDRRFNKEKIGQQIVKVIERTL